MKTLTRHPAAIHAVPGPDAGARAAWRRRVARVGSEIQLAFAALWFIRGTLATGGPARLSIGIALAAGILLIAVPGSLALALTGNTLTAAAGLATAVILTASAITGFRALAGGTLADASSSA